MGFFSNQYKDCVKKYEQEFLNEAVRYANFSDPTSVLTSVASLKRMDLENELRAMNCPDIEKYLQKFTAATNKYMSQYTNAGNKEKKLYDAYVSKMKRVATSSKSAADKKREIANLVAQAKKEITDPSLLADLTISQVYDLEREIDRREMSNMNADISGRLDALRNAPGARRAKDLAREELEDMMSELREQTGRNKGRRF